MLTERSTGFNRSIQSYKIGYVGLRWLIVSLVAVGVIQLIVVLVPKPDYSAGPRFVHYATIIVVFNLVSEVQILLDRVLERYLPVPKNYKLRLVIQLSVGIILLAGIHHVTMFTLAKELSSPESHNGVYLALMFGLLFVYMLANSLIYTRFFEKWVQSQNIIKEMEKEKLRMDYNSLQNQLNPHFLFNNLSVLKSLITYDKDAALEFTENFTDVYRYVLQCKDRHLVSLKEELAFIHSYIALHQERLGKGLLVNFNLNDKDMHRDIAPLTLQLLVENAIKHNKAKNEMPLQIDIGVEDDFLCVSNNIQLRNSTYSTKTGLRNLVKRYELLSENEIRILSDEKEFTVKVPLL